MFMAPLLLLLVVLVVVWPAQYSLNNIYLYDIIFTLSVDYQFDSVVIVDGCGVDLFVVLSLF